MTDYILQVISNWYLQPKCVRNVFFWIRFNNNIQRTITGPDQFKDYTPFLQIINTSSHYLSSKSRMLIQNLCCYSTPLTKPVGSVSCKRSMFLSLMSSLGVHHTSLALASSFSDLQHRMKLKSFTVNSLTCTSRSSWSFVKVRKVIYSFTVLSARAQIAFINRKIMAWSSIEVAFT